MQREAHKLHETLGELRRFYFLSPSEKSLYKSFRLHPFSTSNIQLADPGGTRNAPPVQLFFNLMQIFGKIYQNNRLVSNPQLAHPGLGNPGSTTAKHALGYWAEQCIFCLPVKKICKSYIKIVSQVNSIVNIFWSCFF